jgi:hypothetical protein
MNSQAEQMNGMVDGLISLVEGSGKSRGGTGDSMALSREVIVHEGVSVPALKWKGKE